VLDWRDLGLVDAVAVWLTHPPTGLLRLAGRRGVGANLVNWRPGHRAGGGPLWQALTTGEPVRLDLGSVPLGLAAPLRMASVDHWTAHGLQAPDGEDDDVGVVVVGQRHYTGDPLPLRVTAAALRRATQCDHHRWRSAWFDALAELVGDGAIVATPDGEVHAYNDALEGLTGWSFADVRTHGWTNLVYPDPEVRDELQRAIAALVLGQPSEGTVRTLARKDGTRLQASVWSRLLPHPSDQAPAMMGVFRDVTEARNLALQRSREDSLAKLGRLAGGVAHEFNNLLGAIMGHAELIEMASDDDQVRSRATTIVNSTRRGASLSKQLLAFSGATMSQSRPLRIESLVGETVELMQAAFPEPIELGVVFEEGLRPVEADAPQLQHALTNLITNARDAARHAVRVWVVRAELPDELSYRAPDAPPPGTQMCCVRVHDDGQGFTDDALAHLFEPFYTSKSRGHGLGLPAVRGIMGTHRGGLDVRYDDGAVVELYLPFSHRPELSLPQLTAGRATRGGRLWLIDDESALLEFARISLEIEGYEVSAFAGGEAALAHARSGQAAPDLMVVDVVMPGMSGPEVVHALADAGVITPVLWTSGYTPESAQVPPDSGRFLQKPFTGRELAAEVARILADLPGGAS